MIRPVVAAVLVALGLGMCVVALAFANGGQEPPVKCRLFRVGQNNEVGATLDPVSEWRDFDPAVAVGTIAPPEPFVVLCVRPRVQKSSDRIG